MTAQPDRLPTPRAKPSAIVGDVVFGAADSPVAVCTLGSRTLLPALAGKSEIAVAGRVFTENVGVERMIQNLVAFDSVRFLILCGRETPHRVGQTILALHAHGLDQSGRVIGSTAPEPVLPNLSPEQLSEFQRRYIVVDLIGKTDPAAILARARELAARPVDEAGSDASGVIATADAVRVVPVAATRDRASDWVYDPIGYFVVFVDRAHQVLRVEHHGQDHRLLGIFEGRGAEELCHTIVRQGAVTLLAHAAYLGRELAKAEAALTFGLEYDQDRPLSGRAPSPVAPTPDEEEESSGDRAGNRRAP